jgi:hypothetical protein
MSTASRTHASKSFLNGVKIMPTPPSLTTHHPPPTHPAKHQPTNTHHPANFTHQAPSKSTASNPPPHPSKSASVPAHLWTAFVVLPFYKNCHLVVMTNFSFGWWLTFLLGWIHEFCMCKKNVFRPWFKIHVSKIVRWFFFCFTQTQ